MPIIISNPKFSDDLRRQHIFQGDFLLHAKRNTLRQTTDYAQSLIVKHFGTDPEKAQFTMAVEEFVKVAGALKGEFTNSYKSKELIREIIKDFGADMGKTYFDVPRLRVVTSDNYLTAGVGYAYKAHRDTWYASPQCQVNWWLPVYDTVKENTMSMYPGYWDQSIKNSSSLLNYDEWCNEGRKLALSLVEKDTRNHPLPLESVNEITETRFVLSSGDIMIFSAAHLHATAPNNSGKTRFSIDFRTLNIDDLKLGKGAKNIDNASTGTTLNDFLQSTSFEKLPSN